MKDLYTKILLRDYSAEIFGQESWALKKFTQDILELESQMQNLQIMWGLDIEISLKEPYKKNEKVVGRGIVGQLEKEMNENK
jgi:hypothetical protein